MPATNVFSFDIDPWARAQQKRLARLNGVRNLTLASSCAAGDLDALNKGRSLLICDIEGGEYDLLDPRNAASLRHYDILVEMHPCERQGLNAGKGAEFLAARFQATHEIECIEMLPRSLEAFAMRHELSGFSPEELAQCVDEGRSFDQCWLWLQSRHAIPDPAPSAGAGRPNAELKAERPSSV
jgi:hypothetical protein